MGAVIFYILLLAVSIGIFVLTYKMEKDNINQIKADIIIYIDDSDGNAEKKLKEFFAQIVWFNMTESECIFLLNVTKSPETEELCRYYEKKYPNIKIWE